MVEFVHSVPGRLRIRISSIRQEPRIADDASKAILSIPGVADVSANIITGSLVIIHDRAGLSTTALWNEVRRRLGSGKADAASASMDRAPEPAASPGSEWVDQAARAAIDALIGKMVERAAVALVRAVV
jgi:hypothetical protein